MSTHITINRTQLVLSTSAAGMGIAAAHHAGIERGHLSRAQKLQQRLESARAETGASPIPPGSTDGPGPWMTVGPTSEESMLLRSLVHSQEAAGAAAAAWMTLSTVAVMLLVATFLFRTRRPDTNDGGDDDGGGGGDDLCWPPDQDPGPRAARELPERETELVGAAN